MTSVNAYLNFQGNCEEVFRFYQSVFGGEFGYVARYKEMPAEQQIPDEHREKIMHISLPIGGNSILMGCDAVGEWAGNPIQGNNISLSINTDSRAEADRLFQALVKNGNPTMPMGDVFWGSYFGMATDQFGIHWMISYDQIPG